MISKASLQETGHRIRMTGAFLQGFEFVKILSAGRATGAFVVYAAQAPFGANIIGLPTKLAVPAVGGDHFRAGIRIMA
jgi:hypothetical protein